MTVTAYHHAAVRREREREGFGSGQAESLPGFHYVLEPLGQDGVYMIVRKRIVDGFPVTAVLHQLYLL